MMRPEPTARLGTEKEAVGSGDNTGEPLGKVAGIYRVNSDGTIEPWNRRALRGPEKPPCSSLTEE